MTSDTSRWNRIGRALLRRGRDGSVRPYLTAETLETNFYFGRDALTRLTCQVRVALKLD